MKTERYIYWMMIVVLVLTNIYLLIIYTNNNDKIIEVKNSNSTQDSNDKILGDIFDFAKISNGTIIDRNLEFRYGSGDSVILKNIIVRFPTLIFDFSKINCMTCFEDEIIRFKEVANEILDDMLTKCDKIFYCYS